MNYELPDTQRPSVEHMEDLELKLADAGATIAALQGQIHKMRRGFSSIRESLGFIPLLDSEDEQHMESIDSICKYWTSEHIPTASPTAPKRHFQGGGN